MIYINTVSEDFLSEIVLESLINSCDEKYSIAQRIITDGNGRIKKNLNGYNNASRFTPFCVLTDLDKISCPPQLIAGWTENFTIHPNLIFRVAVKEIEAWILSDTVGFSKFSGIGRSRLPTKVEELNDPKATLLGLVARFGKAKIREALLPRDEYATIGPNYNLLLGEFVAEQWDVHRARANAQSLDRMVTKLESFEPVSL